MSRAPGQREFAYTDADFNFVVGKAKELAGITLAPHKRDMVYSRLARRVRALGMASISDYCAFLNSEHMEQEVGHFINALTTNLTSFYRESHHFTHLHDELQSLQRSQNSGRLRIWSAGCSAGMETYTIALTCADAISRLDSWDLKILATDIDTNILQRAQNGIYSEKDLESVPPKLLDKYFDVYPQANEPHFQVRDSLKQLITFKKLNLMDKFWPMKGPFDVIFCRNVMIYFDKPTQEILFGKFSQLLRPNGLLYIGHSESIRGATDKFRYIGNTIYQRVAE